VRGYANGLYTLDGNPGGPQEITDR
jgi:hypothetical protein